MHDLTTSSETLLQLLHSASGIGLALVSAAIAWRDIRDRIITGRALLLFTALSLLDATTAQNRQFREILAGSILSGMLMTTAAWLSKALSGRPMIGRGDLYLAFPAGLAAGNLQNALNMLAYAFLLAFMPSLVCAAVDAAARKGRRRRSPAKASPVLPAARPRAAPDDGRTVAEHEAQKAIAGQNAPIPPPAGEPPAQSNVNRRNRGLPFLPFLLLGLLAVRITECR